MAYFDHLRAAVGRWAAIVISFWIVLGSTPRSNGGPLIRLNGPFAENESISGLDVSPDGRWIAYSTWLYSSTTFKRLSIFSVPIAGGEVRQLDRPAFADAFVDERGWFFSSDSKSLVYNGVQSASGLGGVFIASLDGSTSRQLGDYAWGNSGFFPYYQFLPDNSRLIYQHEISGALKSVPVEGGSPITLNAPLQKNETTIELSDQISRSFEVTPDSSRILYTVFRAGPPDYPYGNLISSDLYSVRPDGTDRRLLAHDALNGVKISPDSSRVVFARAIDSYPYAPQTSSFSVGVTGGVEVPLHPPLPYRTSASADLITPDSQQVVLVSDMASDDHFDYYRVPLTGGTPIRLNAPLRDGDLVQFESLSPDGRYFLYDLQSTAHDDGGVYRAALDGGPLLKLSGPLPPGGEINGLAISGDGSRITYLSDTGHSAAIFTVSIDGQNLTQVSPTLASSFDVNFIGMTYAGDQVVYSADVSGTGKQELFVVPTARGNPVRLNPPLADGDGVMSVIIAGNWVVFSCGHNFSQRDLYAVQIPEPVGSELACVAALCLHFIPGRKRDQSDL